MRGRAAMSRALMERFMPGRTWPGTFSRRRMSSAGPVEPGTGRATQGSGLERGIGEESRGRARPRAARAQGLAVVDFRGALGYCPATLMSTFFFYRDPA